MDIILQKFISAGLPVIPIVKTKKIPLIKSHKFLDEVLPVGDNPEYQQITTCDYAIKCGNDQTKIECIDIDLKNLKSGKDEYWEKLSGLLSIPVLQSIYLEKTPSGGLHILYRSELPTPGSKKLAKSKGIKEAIIETRGRGGYVIVAPSTGYKILQGDIYNLPVIPESSIIEIKRACYAMDECPPEPETKTNHIHRVFNAKNIQVAYDLLLTNGWSIAKEHPDRVWLTRPGKEKGVSATFYKQSGYLYCFTSSTEFAENKAFTPFDIIRKCNGTPIEQMERIASEDCGEKFIFDVTREIMRNNAKLKPIDVKDLLSKTIIDHLEKNGYFITEQTSAYYFSNKKLLNVKSDKFNYMLYSLYSLQKNDQLMNHVLQSIIHHAFTTGKKTTVYKYLYNNGDCIYIDNFNGTMWKITKKDIDNVDNGTDNILFLETDNTPIEYKPESGLSFSTEIFEGFTFEEGQLTNMETIKLFVMWLCAIYFMGKNKPIVALIGQPGSGKSFLFRKILYFLFGNDYALKIMPEKAPDFWPIVTNNKLVILDNVDTHQTWLCDALAVCATSATHSGRELYTTNEEANYAINCFLGITSRTPPFVRDDIVDRLLIFNMKRFEDGFIAESDLMDKIMARRNIFMSFLFEFLQKILNIIQSQKEEIRSVTRMADFEIFCRKVDPTMKGVFEKLKQEQSSMGENDGFSDTFYKWCQFKNLDGAVEITARDLASELSEKSKVKYNSHYISYRLKSKFSFCDVEIMKKYGNKKIYTIRPKVESI